MNKIKELKSQAEQHRKESEELYRQIEALEDKPKVFKPEIGDWYNFINDHGGLSAHVWKNDTEDNFRLNVGNIYPPKIGQRVLNCISSIIELRDGWVPDYQDHTQPKWGFKFYGGWLVDSFYSNAVSNPMPTKEAAQTILDEFEDVLPNVLRRL